MSQKNMSQKKMRADRVVAGKCGFCNKDRVNFAWLCDDCAAKHRERQRVKSLKENRILQRDKLLAYLREARNL